MRVNGTTALPESKGKPIQAAERTYGLMIHMSQGLGVNCTYCHNTRAISQWSQSTPQRVQAWHGIRMVRDLNAVYRATPALYERDCEATASTRSPSRW